MTSYILEMDFMSYGFGTFSRCAFSNINRYAVFYVYIDFRIIKRIRRKEIIIVNVLYEDVINDYIDSFQDS